MSDAVGVIFIVGFFILTYVFFMTLLYDMITER